MIKSIFRLSLRMVTGFVQSLIKLCGLDWAAPDYSTICRRQKHIDIQINYEKSCNGLHLLIDSTSLKFLGEGEWRRKKIETLFSLLKGTYNLVTTRARSVAGYLAGIYASLCAYQLCHQNKSTIRVMELLA